MATKTKKVKLKKGVTPAMHARHLARVKQQKKDNANPLYNPNAALSGSALKKAASDTTKAEYAPQEGALDKASADATTQGTALAQRSKDYYAGIATHDAASIAQQKALGALLQSSTKAIGDTAAARNQAATAQSEQYINKDAQTRGAGLDGGSAAQAAQTGQALAGRSAAVGQAAETAAANNSGTWNGLTNSMAQSRQLHGGEVQDQLLTRLANKQGDIAAQKATLEANKGAKNASNLLTLRQQGFENSATAKGLDVKYATVAEQAAAAKLSAKTSAANAKRAAKTSTANSIRSTTQSNINSQRAANTQLTKAQIQASVQAGKKAAVKNESAASVKSKQGIVSALQTYQRLGKSGLHKVAQHLRHQGVAEPLITAAADLYTLGHISPAHQAELKAAGVMIPSAWKVKVKKK